MKQKILIKALDKKTYEIEGKLVNQKNTKQPTIREMLGQVIYRLDNIENRLISVENDVKAIKNTPTMKKELNK